MPENPPPNLCLSSHRSNPLLHHHHQSLSQAPRKTWLMLTRGQENPLSRYRTTPNRLPARKVMRNSPSGAGWALRLSMTGRDELTGMWPGNAGIVARSATVHGGVGRAWHTILRWGFGTQTNPERFELAEGQCYEFHPTSSPLFLFLPHVSLTFYHCFILIVSPWLMLRLDGCTRQHVALLSLATHSL